jgi:hypothetical protein
MLNLGFKLNDMIHWSIVVFTIVCATLIILTFKNYRTPGSGSGYGDVSGIINIFWGLVLLIFIAVWGGIFWW